MFSGRLYKISAFHYLCFPLPLPLMYGVLWVNGVTVLAPSFFIQSSFKRLFPQTEFPIDSNAISCSQTPYLVTSRFNSHLFACFEKLNNSCTKMQIRPNSKFTPVSILLHGANTRE